MALRADLGQHFSFSRFYHPPIIIQMSQSIRITRATAAVIPTATIEGSRRGPAYYVPDSDGLIARTDRRTFAEEAANEGGQGGWGPGSYPTPLQVGWRDPDRFCI